MSPTFEMLCLLSALCGEPSTITVLPTQPFMCATGPGCEQLADEYGCHTFGPYLWCDKAALHKAIVRHSA
jgi:hypothetical protein